MFGKNWRNTESFHRWHLLLNGILHVVRKLMEEVQTRSLFHLSHATHVIGNGLKSGCVLIEKSTGKGAAALVVRDVDYLEKGIRNSYPVLAHGMECVGAEDRASHDINTVETLRPFSASLFQIFPVLLVEVSVLRADIGHEESVFLSLVGPFVVLCGTHVSSLVTTFAFAYVAVQGTWSRYLSVLEEFVSATRIFTICMGSGQQPSHPVGAKGAHVVGSRIGIAQKALVIRLSLDPSGLMVRDWHGDGHCVRSLSGLR